MPTVIEVYSAFARTYKLGKQAEDALDKLSDQGKQMAENPSLIRRSSLKRSRCRPRRKRPSRKWN
jgi:hypothetical protein